MTSTFKLQLLKSAKAVIPDLIEGGKVFPSWRKFENHWSWKFVKTDYLRFSRTGIQLEEPESFEGRAARGEGRHN